MIDYDELMEGYRNSLTTVLRGFRAGDFREAFLETWVPDEDDARSIEGIFEAAVGAGEEGLALKVSSKTVGRVSRSRAEAVASRFGALRVRDSGDGLVLDVRFDGRERTGGQPPDAEQRARSTTETSARAALGPAVSSVVDRAAQYDDALRAIDAFVHEGTADIPGTTLASSLHGEATLELHVDGQHVILAARHRGARGDERHLLEALCRVVEGLPLREAADHGAARLEQRLRGRGGPRVVPGIQSPDNADPRVAACGRTMRAILAEHGALVVGVDGPNEFVVPPRAEWAAAPREERERRARSALAAAADRLDLASSAVELIALRGDAQVLIAFSPDVAPDLRPSLLLRLEGALRTDVEENLTLYLEEMADTNRIRRLSLKRANASENENG